MTEQNTEQTKKSNSKKLYFSIFSGILYEVGEDEIFNLDEGQIPLLGKPKTNCKRCYGRGFTDKDSLRNIYSICRCLRDKIDYQTLREHLKKDNSKFSIV